MLGISLTWVARTGNSKTGDIPTAYVGESIEECRASCEGCALLGTRCYAWPGLIHAAFHRILARKEIKPENYTIRSALERRSKNARVARVGAMGDPAKADPDEVMSAVRMIQNEGLDGVMAYTHFWREDWAQWLRDTALASCDNDEEAEEAISMGWTPALLLPWNAALNGDRIVVLGSGDKILICPAQTKDNVTCNDCRMCWTAHPVWEGKKIQGIGFLDHSRKARSEKKRWENGKQLPIFPSGIPDTRL